MKTFNWDHKLKEALLLEILKHQKCDQIEKWTYGMKVWIWKWCAVWCSLRSLAIVQGKKLKEEYCNHKDYEGMWLPEWLGRLEDVLFEWIEEKYSNKFPYKFIKAIPVGIDDSQMNIIKWKFCSYLMIKNIKMVKKLHLEKWYKLQVIEIIKLVLKFLQNSITIGKCDKMLAMNIESIAICLANNIDWSTEMSARNAVNTASWSAAINASRSAVWSVGSSVTANEESVASTACWSAESASWAASISKNMGDLETISYKKYSDYLIKLFKNI